eukprot:scaffold18912_cov21-Tisochrysis_lutea.AAC.1
MPWPSDCFKCSVKNAGADACESNSVEIMMALEEKFEIQLDEEGECRINLMGHSLRGGRMWRLTRALWYMLINDSKPQIEAQKSAAARWCSRPVYIIDGLLAP